MPFSDEHQTPTRRESTDASNVGVAPAAPPLLTSLADGRERRLDPKTIRAERLAGAILAAILSAALLVGVVAAGIFGSLGLTGALLLLGGWFAASMFVTGLLLWWPSKDRDYADQGRVVVQTGKNRLTGRLGKSVCEIDPGTQRFGPALAAADADAWLHSL